MHDPFDPEALFKKAQLFTNRSFEAKARSEFDTAALWASLGLEILAKWALASVNPCLIADPSDDGKSLLTAAGLSKNVAGFRTIPAKAAYSRCARAFPPFNEREATRISGNRNDDVHSGALPFAALHEETWWQRYWSEAAILLNAHGLSVHDLVGERDADTAEDYVRRNAETVSLLTTSQISRAAEYYRGLTVEAQRTAHLVVTEGEYFETATCPACENPGFVSGDSVLGSEDFYPDSPEDYFTPVSVLEVGAESFECPYCNLTLYGADYLKAAGLPETLESEVELGTGWEEYNNE